MLLFCSFATFELGGEVAVILFKFLISSFERINSSSAIVPYFSQLFWKSLFLVSLSIYEWFKMDELGGLFLGLELILFQISKIGLQSFVNFHLNELFQTLILLKFELNIRLLRDQELVSAKLLLV